MEERSGNLLLKSLVFVPALVTLAVTLVAFTVIVGSLLGGLAVLVTGRRGVSAASAAAG